LAVCVDLLSLPSSSTPNNNYNSSNKNNKRMLIPCMQHKDNPQMSNQVERMKREIGESATTIRFQFKCASPFGLKNRMIVIGLSKAEKKGEKVKMIAHTDG